MHTRLEEPAAQKDRSAAVSVVRVRPVRQNGTPESLSVTKRRDHRRQQTWPDPDPGFGNRIPPVRFLPAKG